MCVVRRDTVRQLVTGVGAAFGVLSVLAVLSRLEPSLFPTDQVAAFFPGSQARLSYPLNYANGTGEFLAIGIPLLLMIATGAANARRTGARRGGAAGRGPRRRSDRLARRRPDRDRRRGRVLRARARPAAEAR